MKRIDRLLMQAKQLQNLKENKFPLIVHQTDYNKWQMLHRGRH